MASVGHANDCSVGEPFEHHFASGASWQFCVVLDDDHALELQNIHYQAPGDTSRQVLKHLHLGQVLLHFHDSVQADVLIGRAQLGNDALKTLTDKTCDGELHTLGNQNSQLTLIEDQPALLCSYVRNTGLMAKYNLRPGLQGSQYRLFTVSQYKGFTFQIQVSLSEDGRIAPSVLLSGKNPSVTTDTRFGNQLRDPVEQTALIGTRATVLYTWRMAFALNDNEPNDTVEEFNFILEPTLGSRRPMQVSELVTESLRDKDRDSFRGWRVKDVNGSGYYLDPQNSGYGYTDWQNNWAQFDIALTAYKACERHSRINKAVANGDTTIDSNADCIGSLDDFISGESMTGQHPVLWYSMSRVYRPRAEDYPIISSMPVEFEIIPFDWTPTSPFEVNQ